MGVRRGVGGFHAFCFYFCMDVFKHKWHKKSIDMQTAPLCTGPFLSVLLVLLQAEVERLAFDRGGFRVRVLPCRDASGEGFGGNDAAEFRDRLLQFFVGGDEAEVDTVVDVQAGVLTSRLHVADDLAGVAFAFEFRRDLEVECQRITLNNFFDVQFFSQHIFEVDELAEARNDDAGQWLADLHLGRGAQAEGLVDVLADGFHVFDDRFVDVSGFRPIGQVDALPARELLVKLFRQERNERRDGLAQTDQDVVQRFVRKIFVAVVFRLPETAA